MRMSSFPPQPRPALILYSGNFVWVNLGGKLGFSDAKTEKIVFQQLLDGGVYIVGLHKWASGCMDDRVPQAPGTAYHNNKAGWYRVTFSVARGNLVVGLAKMEVMLGLQPVC